MIVTVCQSDCVRHKNFDVGLQNLLLTKAAFIALLDLSIIHWSFSKNWAKEPIRMF